MKMVKEMQRIKPHLEKLNFNLVFIGNGPPDQSRWFRTEAGMIEPIYLDQKKKLYKSLLCKSSVYYYFSPRAQEKIEEALQEGYQAYGLNEKPGDPLQLGGVFALSDSGILFRFSESFLGDSVDFSDLLKSCEKHKQKISRSKDLINYEDLPAHQILKSSWFMTYISAENHSKKWSTCVILA